MNKPNERIDIDHSGKRMALQVLLFSLALSLRQIGAATKAISEVEGQIVKAGANITPLGMFGHRTSQGKNKRIDSLEFRKRCKYGVDQLVQQGRR